MGISGDTLRALLALRPEIYGNIAEKVELNGLCMLLSVFLKESRNVDLLTLSAEGYFKPFPLFLQKKRNCYRIDEEQMNVEITRGRSIFMIF
jgi:hypothetical protein